jgi:pimeloyl-ACP methyl ester carboxylesterase
MVENRTMGDVGRLRVFAVISAFFAPALAACGDDVPSGSGTDTEAASGDGTTTATGDGDGGSDTVVLDETGEPPGACEGPTELRYDPMAGGLDALPDDFYTVPDDAAPTGLRVDMRLGENVVLADTAAAFQRVFDGASTLDGFGTTAGLYVQFSDSIDPASLPASGEGSASPDASVVLVDLEADPPAFVDVEWTLVAEDPGDTRTTLAMEPLVPLRPQSRYALAITSDVTDASGGCVAPSPAMAALLSGEAEEPELQRVQERVSEAIGVLQGAGVVTGPEELVGVVTFTTQHTYTESAEIAGQIRAAAPPVFTPTGSCDDGDPATAFRICEGTLNVSDFTVDSVVDPSLSPQGSYDLPLVAYLPKDAAPPFPVMVYGHGLGGDRFQAEALAEFSAPIGYAVVAVDAPRHGDHPHAPGINAVLDFFGLSLNLDDPLDALALRDNFRTGAYDKLALVQMLLSGVDADDDGEVDLDPDRVSYLGVSLGGLMGPELAAFAPELDAAIFIVPGARVSGIVAAGQQFQVIVDIFAGMATEGEVARFFPLLQMVIDRGDPGVYAPFVAETRLRGFDEARPQVLMQMVLNDDTVPNVSNTYFARCLGVPHVGSVIVPIGVVPLEPDLPTAGNLDAEHTGGCFQLDVVLAGEGPATEPATHGNVARSSLAQLQITRFLETLEEGGVSEIVDPYEELGVPH